MTTSVTITHLQEGIYAAVRPLSDGMDVRALLVLGERRAVVLDTLTCPEDMAPFLGILATAGRPVIVVNTHADWDHVWGNAAFPGAAVIGQRLCRARLLSGDEQLVLQEKQRQEPAHYANVRIIAPEICFETTLEIDLGGLTVQLHHLPGHTKDAVMAYLPERRLLFAADCAEDPFPQLYSGPLASWVEGLNSWATRDLASVVPAHGRIGGTELLRANAAYLDGLRGVDTMPDLDGLPPEALPFYREGHESNRAMAASLLLGNGS